jgi:hypothetical protein
MAGNESSDVAYCVREAKWFPTAGVLNDEGARSTGNVRARDSGGGDRAMTAVVTTMRRVGRV